MKKFLFILFSVSLYTIYYILSTPSAQAGDFSTNLDAIYTASDRGIVEASLYFVITNLSTDVYTKSFSLNLENVKPQNALAVIDGNEIPLTNLKVVFPEKVVGKGKSQKFEITFKDSSLIQKTGKIWEISLPKIPELDTYNS
jgi:hypothetical protein